MMIKIANRMLALVMTLSLVACASGPRVARLQIESKPEGAKIYEDNKLLGEAPIVRHYSFVDNLKVFETPTIKAVWPSGATTDTFYQLKPTDDVIAVLERPKSAPNSAVDTEYGNKVHEMTAKQADISRGITQRELSLSSDRCRAQQNGTSKAMQDDCSPQ